MKRNILLIALLAIASSVQAQDLTRFVNLYIGTGGHGHTHPAAMVPHGMVQPGPDTRHHGWDACSGYYYEDRTINGFAQTRLSGTGCADMSDFLLMPLNAVPETWHNGDKGGRYDCSWASSFSHEEEKAEPGYYSVLLRRYDIKAEITATERTALYRFEYNTVRGFKNIQTNAMMLLDLDYTNQNQYLLESNFKRIGDDMLLCYHRTQGWAYNQPVYLAVKFSSPFDLEEIRDTVVEKGRTYPCHKLLLHFRKDADGNEPIHVMAKAAISYCSWDGARRNLEAEQPAWDFEGTRTKAREKWNKCLSKIELNELGEAAADSTREIFYTALYHANIAPNLFSDVDGSALQPGARLHCFLPLGHSPRTASAHQHHRPGSQRGLPALTGSQSRPRRHSSKMGTHRQLHRVHDRLSLCVPACRHGNKGLQELPSRESLRPCHTLRRMGHYGHHPHPATLEDGGDNAKSPLL